MKIDKTKEEARDAFMNAYGMSTQLQLSPDPRVAIWEGVKAALGLEFREEEGEGLPKTLGCAGFRGGAFGLTDGEGNILAQVGIAADSREKERIAINALQKALGRYNDFPALEALARELGESEFTYDPRVQGLISRARELTGKEVA